MYAPDLLSSLVLFLLAWPAQASTMTVKIIDFSRTETLNLSPSWSNSPSHSEAGMKTDANGDAETTYVEEVHIG
ncbi:hypothetical protein PM082_006370 [Marasmius tenuissimus]|nr:hypothetical protein PM082_006370 [Marasmius tenuissimus]